MAFNQFKLDLATFQNRDIFNTYVYEAGTDTQVQVASAGYFDDSRFRERDPEVWVGSFISAKCTDGLLQGFIESDGTITPEASGSDIISTLSDGQVPKKDTVTDSLIYGGATVDPASGVWTFDSDVIFPGASAGIGETVKLSEGGSDLVVANLIKNQMAISVNANFNDSTGSSLPDFIDFGDPFATNINIVETDVITNNPLTFDITGFATPPDVTLVDRATIKTNGAMTNVRAKITDNITGLALLYIPSKAAFEGRKPGLDIGIGDVKFFFAEKGVDDPNNFYLGYVPFIIEDGQQVDFEIVADSVDLLGNPSDFPYLILETHDGPPVDLAERSIALHVQTTGLLSGGVVSQASATTVDWTAGSGQVADYSDPVNPVVTSPRPVKWGAATGVAVTNVATDGNTVFAYNSVGAVVQKLLTSVTIADSKDLIFFGAVTHFGGVIVGVTDAPGNLAYDGIGSYKNFMNLIVGPANVDGNIYSANGTNLSINVVGGSGFILASNFRNNPKLPDTITLPSLTALTFQKVYQSVDPGLNIALDGAPTTFVDPTQYDNEGVLTAVTAGFWTIPRIFRARTGTTFVAYGQQEFASRALALEALGSESFEEKSPLPFTLFRCSLLLAQDATDLSDTAQAEFFKQSSFRSGGAQSANSTIPGVTSPGGVDTSLQYNEGSTFGGASNILYSGSSLNFLDDTVLSMGTDDDISFVHNGINAIISNSTGDVFFDNTDPSGSFAFRLLGVFPATTRFDVRDENSADIFSVLGTGAVQLPDNVPLRFGVGNDFTIIHNETDTLLVSATGNMEFYNTDVAASTFFTLGTDTAATSFKVRDNSTDTLFEVLGDGNVGIGTSTPNAPLQFSNAVANRKIVFFDTANNDHQFYGFGLQSGELRYQVQQPTTDHVFYAGTSSTTSDELMRIAGDGKVTLDVLYPENVVGYIRNGETGFAERHISTGVFSATTIPLTATGIIYGAWWGKEGTRLYVTTADAYIYQYDLTVPYDITTATLTASNSFVDPSNSEGFTLWNDDGTVFYHGGRGYRAITLTSAWEISGIATDTGNHSLSFQDPINMYDLRWNFDGTKVIGVGDSINQAQRQSFVEWDCTTPYDLTTTTATDANIYPFPTGVPDGSLIVQGFDISPDGTRVYLSARSTGIEYEVVLETAWDLSSGTLVNTITRTSHTDILNYSMAPDASGMVSVTPAGLIVQKKYGLEFDGNLIVNDGNVGIGTSTPNAPLEFAKVQSFRKIVLFGEDNDNEFYGFGVQGGRFLYQVDSTAADHVFFAATSFASSQELFKIDGSGNSVTIGAVGTGGRFAFIKSAMDSSLSLYSGTSGGSASHVFYNSTPAIAADIIYDETNNNFSISTELGVDLILATGATANIGVNKPNPVSTLHISEGTTTSDATTGTTFEQIGLGSAVTHYLRTLTGTVFSSGIDDDNVYKISNDYDLATDTVISINTEANTDFKNTIATPYGGFGELQNLIRWSEDTTNAVWSDVPSVVVKTANNALAPDGTLNADTWAYTGTTGIATRQFLTVGVGATYTVSFWARALVSNRVVRFDLGDGSAVDITVLVTDDLQRYSGTVVAGAQNWLDVTNPSLGASTIQVWGIQVNEGTERLPYTRTEAIQVHGTGPESGLAVNHSAIFSTIAAPNYSEGTLFYDDGDKALSYYNEIPNVIVGLGRDLLVRVQNDEGLTISSGEAVYINGSASGLPTVRLARSDSLVTSQVAGIVNESFILNGEVGYISAFGLIEFLNTSAWLAGDQLYLSSTVAGALTKFAPASPNHIVSVAHAVISDLIVGSIQVHTPERIVTDGLKRVTFAATTTTVALGRSGIYAYTATGAPVTLTLSTVTLALGSLTQVIEFTVIDEAGDCGTNTVTLDTEGAEQINGADTYLLDTDHASVTLYTNGVDYFII